MDGSLVERMEASLPIYLYHFCPVHIGIYKTFFAPALKPQTPLEQHNQPASSNSNLL
jgi:hypothetical protein